MAFVPDQRYDVFVSYAHVDNMPFPGTEQGWVSTLVETLEILLAQKLGRREGFEVWMDRDLSRHRQITPEILDSLSATATLLLILSPGYLASEWCLREKDTFLALVRARRRTGSRIFLVERDRVELSDRPSELGDILGYRFWVPDQKDGTPLVLGMPFPDPRNPRQMPYFDELTRLAYDLAGELKALRDSGGSAAGGGTGHGPAAAGEPGVFAASESQSSEHLATPARLSPASARSMPAPSTPIQPLKAESPTIFLAEVTDDLDTRSSALRTYFEQAGLRVLPASLYPRDRDGFSAALDADLASSTVFVQLLSALPGKRPPDLPQGYVRLQYERAAAAGLAVVQWRAPQLDPATVEDEAQRGLLELETVMAVSVDELQREVVRLATVEPETAIAQPADGLVFVNVEAGDIEIAQPLCEALEARGLSCVLPLAGGSPAEVRADLEQNLMFCDALVIVYGSISPRWVRDQLLLLRKIAWKRETPIKALAVYEGPPQDKEPLRFGQPGLITLDGRAGLDPAALEPLLAALGEGA